MTALSLYDSLARGHAATPAAQAALVEVAEKPIATSLASLKHIEDFDEHFGFPDSPEVPRAQRVARAVWHLYAEWLREADQIFSRARELRTAGADVAGVKDLNIAIGHVESRLQWTPEQYARAVRQMRDGDVV